MSYCTEEYISKSPYWSQSRGFHIFEVSTIFAYQILEKILEKFSGHFRSQLIWKVSLSPVHEEVGHLKPVFLSNFKVV